MNISAEFVRDHALAIFVEPLWILDIAHEFGNGSRRLIRHRLKQKVGTLQLEQLRLRTKSHDRFGGARQLGNIARKKIDFTRHGATLGWSQSYLPEVGAALPRAQIQVVL